MPRDDALKRLSETLNRPVEGIILEGLDNHNHNVLPLAMELRVAPNTIYHWLVTHHYHRDAHTKRWIKWTAFPEEINRK